MSLTAVSMLLLSAALFEASEPAHTYMLSVNKIQLDTVGAAQRHLNGAHTLQEPKLLFQVHVVTAGLHTIMWCQSCSGGIAMLALITCC